jgi:hypothetical protein
VTGPRFNVDVQLTGTDGNAFALIGKVRRALREAGASREEQAEFIDAATFADYDNLLRTAMEWVNVL